MPSAAIAELLTRGKATPKSIFRFIVRHAANHSVHRRATSHWRWLVRKHGVRLRQSYRRIAKRATMMAGRYAHAKQFKRHQRQLRLLRSRLVRVIRDLRPLQASRGGLDG